MPTEIFQGLCQRTTTKKRGSVQMLFTCGPTSLQADREKRCWGGRLGVVQKVVVVVDGRGGAGIVQSKIISAGNLKVLWLVYNRQPLKEGQITARDVCQRSWQHSKAGPISSLLGAQYLGFGLETGLDNARGTAAADCSSGDGFKTFPILCVTINWPWNFRSL